ncbi:tRNA (adenosine(37)-N6)-threonylcarbamoyltransferase complex dimerization subunit type 1 TsaB [Leptospira wolffii]|uniref:tRNA (adenosine(37)-N6)-threonylcarbamoyltransferase complex dimerization subunit type 1 TsaB n=1 Tax=Leptospira wolffii TaxID=409998 RepID=UPI00034BF74D|nr:tRNA (adenosine(37)-N6)-threonylcarbamoyltransferase complex dimerization subunit type 1 TsaB [Leptospira wolffii]TGK61892.1 tRNA (adenosine(37)-N6)-threonylcarbamoyltransferase complex dimerization subunit type 1 TsaB [Leptospira wolffii]TGK68493.1 tRNA (adenosine(37)-N6)-threonylcarbamoyltransferase complex dimerization subunit type 1 TsaB [Leptospira wolffii]TGK74724.1 tRNA (adenosine(37)-N6)-threonylcarbamoyltransferase complex dimerization subunit type 1 TsaB [Leptospira wolffii]TGL3170
MNKVLFFDATNSWILIGCYLQEESGKFSLLSKHEEKHNRESSQLLVKGISDCLQKAGWEKPDIIVTGLGPGSFTGIRISVTTARNFAQIWNIPVLGIDSLEIYATHYFIENESPVSVAIEAKQNKVYFGIKDKRGYLGSLDLEPDAIAEKISEDRLGSYITGLKYTDCPDFFPGQDMNENLPSPEAILTERSGEIRNALIKPADHSHLRLVPNYVRGTYADDKPKVHFK